MPPCLPLPHYGNNLRVNAPTHIIKQVPLHREVTADIHTYIVNIDEDVPNAFSQSVFSAACNLPHSKALNKGFPWDYI